MLIYGKQTVIYAAEHYSDKIKELFIAKEIDKELYHRWMQKPFTLTRTKPEFIQKKAKSGNHQGFLAEVEDISLYNSSDLKRFSRIVVLAGLTDMGNIGAIVRSAYALGVEAVVVAGVQKIQPEAIARSSSGALFGMPLVHQPNLLALPNELKQFGFTLYGAAMQGEDVRTVQSAEKWALFVGNEGEGMPAKLLGKLDQRLSIAMEHDFDSLNVSVATAILLDRMR